MTIKCGDCSHFVRDGKCNWYASDDAKRKDRPFAHAPFWVWSDCYSDLAILAVEVFPALIATARRGVEDGSS